MDTSRVSTGEDARLIRAGQKIGSAACAHARGQAHPRVVSLRSALILFLVLLPAASFATTFMNRNLGDVIQEAPFIVRGTVGSSYANWDKSQQQIYTYTDFNVTEVLKGTIKESRILLRQPGGSKDGMELMIPGTAHFAPGEEVVVLLSPKIEEDQSYDVPGFTTGKYRVVTDPKTGAVSLINSLGGGAMFDPQRDPKTLSYASKVPIEVFRKLAKGKKVPESAQKQFQPSATPAPPGSGDDHGHARHAAPAKREPKADTQAAVDESKGAGPTARAATAWWVPLSFIVLLLGASLGIWVLVTRPGPGGGPS